VEKVRSVSTIETLEPAVAVGTAGLTETSLGGQPPVGVGSTVGVGVGVGVSPNIGAVDPPKDGEGEVEVDVPADGDVPAEGDGLAAAELDEAEAPVRSAAGDAFGVPFPPPSRCSTPHSRSRATVTTASRRRQ
jgi:hypothetical protein